MLIVIFFLLPLVAVANDPFGHHDLDLASLSLAFLVFASIAIVCNPHGHSPHVDLGGQSLASFVLTIVHNHFGYDPHVDHQLPFPPSWL
jgi:hypothetical protein